MNPHDDYFIEFRHHGYSWNGLISRIDWERGKAYLTLSADLAGDWNSTCSAGNADIEVSLSNIYLNNVKPRYDRTTRQLQQWLETRYGAPRKQSPLRIAASQTPRFGL